MRETISFNYNQIGIIHNLTLDAITKMPDFPNNSLEEAYYLGIKTQNEVFGYKCDEIEYPEFSLIKPYYELIDGDESYKTVISTLLKNGEISKTLADEMFYHYNNLITVDDYKELRNEVIDFINHFKKEKKLTIEEKIICWGCASVTMFSFHYWKNVEYNPLNPWFKLYNKSDEKKNTKGKFWKIVGTIAADCAGVLIGGAVGSAFGPAGAAAGAGAVGAGASNAVIKSK